ncbi:MAG: trypsin-like peptidase domain-containing protein [Polyangiaceae bacterium]|nr:trypsin-like peptidase domain-containing protein [Polyangiaceae bacterium]
MEPLLDETLFAEVHTAALNAGLADVANRNTLFGGIKPAYKAFIANAGNPIGQLLNDLHHLNKRSLPDGTVPFRTWLRNAVLLTPETEEGQVFQKAIVVVDTKLASSLGITAANTAGFLATYPPDKLKQFLTATLNDKATALGEGAKDPLAILSAASTGDWIFPLLISLLATRIKDPTFVEFAQKQGLFPQISVDRDRLQKIIHTKAQFQDVLPWVTKLTAATACVARVETKINDQWRAAGTGFLVGPDLILTNHHVVQAILGETDVTACLRFRFDFKKLKESGRAFEGVHYFPIAGDKWKVLSAPSSAADEKTADEAAEPGESELDFALIRLAQPAGDLPIGGVTNATVKRGWLEPAGDTSLTQLAVSENLFVLQHPGGDALKVAFGQVSQMCSRRVRYNADTESGASGSPCFDAALNVVALHHAGDPEYSNMHRAEYNQGIPMHLIVAFCKANGVEFEKMA